MTSSQLRAMQGMVYEAVHNAMAGMMPPSPDRAPRQAAIPFGSGSTAKQPNARPAENLPTAGRVRPNGPDARIPTRDVSYGNSYERAIKALNSSKVEYYDGLGDPYKAVQWITHVERLLREVECTERHKVSAASLRLSGTAGDWWESFRPRWEGEPTWEHFKRKFTDHYFSPSLMDEKKREFLQPAPAGLKMFEIVQRYYRRKPYSLELLRNESDEIRYFNEMLPYKIKNSLLHIPRTSLDCFIDAAYRAEASIDEGKRNQELHNRKKVDQKHSGSRRAAPTDGDAGGSKAPTGPTGRWSATKKEQSAVCHNCRRKGTSNMYALKS